MTQKEKFISSGGTFWQGNAAKDLTEDEAKEALDFIFNRCRVLYVG